MLSGSDYEWLRRRKRRLRRQAKRPPKPPKTAEEIRADIERKKELRRAQQRRYYARHKEKCAAMTQRWLEQNPGYHAEDGRLRYMVDPAPKKAHSRAFYEANRERINAARRKSRVEKPVISPTAIAGTTSLQSTARE